LLQFYISFFLDFESLAVSAEIASGHKLTAWGPDTLAHRCKWLAKDADTNTDADADTADTDTNAFEGAHTDECKTRQAHPKPLKVHNDDVDVGPPLNPRMLLLLTLLSSPLLHKACIEGAG